MSSQALAWALEQHLPAKPKLVLIVLANVAGGNGYCLFDAPAIAREAATSEAGLWRQLAALERNEFLSKRIRKSKRGEERDYWLAFTRDPARPWSRAAEDPPDEPAEPPESPTDDLRTDDYRQFLKSTAA